ncbi:hypothetical protein ENBRE01_2268 [Enteropsectra breve]|nr:hypothetical protein ENBRE01_2268 [Enteropsectra breve]
MLGSIDSLLILIACSRCTSADWQEEDNPQEIAAGLTSELAYAQDTGRNLSDTRSYVSINQVNDSVNPAVGIQAEASGSCSQISGNSISSSVISRINNFNVISVDYMASVTSNITEDLRFNAEEKYDNEIRHCTDSESLRNEATAELSADVLKVRNDFYWFFKEMFIDYVDNKSSSFRTCINLASRIKDLIKDILKRTNSDIGVFSKEVKEVNEIREQFKSTLIERKIKERILVSLKSLSTKFIQKLLDQGADRDYKQKWINEAESIKNMARKAKKEYDEQANKYEDLYYDIIDIFEGIKESLADAKQNEGDEETEKRDETSMAHDIDAESSLEVYNELMKILEADYVFEKTEHSFEEDALLLTEEEVKEIKKESNYWRDIRYFEDKININIERYTRCCNAFNMPLFNVRRSCAIERRLVMLPEESEDYRNRLHLLAERIYSMKLKLEEEKAFVESILEDVLQLNIMFETDSCTREQQEIKRQECEDKLKRLNELFKLAKKIDRDIDCDKTSIQYEIISKANARQDEDRMKQKEMQTGSTEVENQPSN